jgi:hypothetical protein
MSLASSSSKESTSSTHVWEHEVALEECRKEEVAHARVAKEEKEQDGSHKDLERKRELKRSLRLKL